MLTIEGPAGATGMLIWSEIPDWRFFGTSLGVLHMSSASLHIVPLGTIPGSGSLTTSITPPQVAAGKDARRLYIQAFAISGASGRLLGTPASLDVLDSSL
jgi:hypothetical protein